MLFKWKQAPVPAVCLAFAFVSVLASVSCRTLKDSELARVPYQDTPPNEGQTFTEARVLSLNKWARDLLSETKDIDDFQRLADDYFAKLGINDAEKMSSYTLSLRPGGECFHDKKDGTDVWWNKHRDQIRAQVESAAQFIFEFHKAMLGKQSGPFAIREVEICPLSVLGRELNFIGQKLVIGIPFSSVRGYSPITSDKLIERWRQGDHLMEDKKAFTSYFTRKKLNKLWMVFDPIGHLRSGLRQTIASNGQSILRRLDTIGPSPDLKNLKSGVIDPVADPKRIRVATDENLEKIVKEKRMQLFTDNWRCLAKSARLADDLSHGAIGGLDQAIRQDENKVNIEIKAGLVAVGNYHQIGVTFGASNSPYSEYIDKPVPNSSTNEINVKVSAGLVSVFTIDDVKVDVAIGLANSMASRSLETASLDAAAQATLANQKLCKG